MVANPDITQFWDYFELTVIQADHNPGPCLTDVSDPAFLATDHLLDGF